MGKTLDMPAAKATTAAIRPKLSSQPWLHQHGLEIQPFGTVRAFPIGLWHDPHRSPRRSGEGC
jgi:starvation-inducible DNA-binding protein